MISANAGWIISAIALMGGLLAWFVKTTIKTELADFRTSMEERFDKKFQNAEIAEAKLTPMRKDIEALHARVNEIEDYAHRWRHAHAGPLQRCVLKLDIENPRDEF